MLAVGVGATAWALMGGRVESAAQSAPQLTAYTAPIEVDTASLPGPRQPIFFRHDIHAGQYEIPCLYCHAYAAEAPKPGIPSMQTCMGCHLVVRGADSANQAEIAKLADAWGEQRAIEWVRVHGVPCTTCHGNVREMAQIYQFSSLKMGWCIDCHEQRQVTRDCTTCHY